MSLDATLENIVAEMLQRLNDKNRLAHEAQHAKKRAEDADEKFEDSRKIIGATYKTEQERRFIYRSFLITISAGGYVEVFPVEVVK